MKKIALIVFLALATVPLMFVSTPAQEAVTLTTPLVATTAALHVGYLGLDLDGSRVIAQVQNAAGLVVTIKVYDSSTVPTGASLLNSINRGNFTVNSLMKAVYARLQTDGIIPAGSVTGSPQ